MPTHFFFYMPRIEIAVADFTILRRCRMIAFIESCAAILTKGTTLRFDGWLCRILCGTFLFSVHFLFKPSFFIKISHSLMLIILITKEHYVYKSAVFRAKFADVLFYTKKTAQSSVKSTLCAESTWICMLFQISLSNLQVFLTAKTAAWHALCNANLK